MQACAPRPSATHRVHVHLLPLCDVQLAQLQVRQGGYRRLCSRLPLSQHSHHLRQRSRHSKCGTAFAPAFAAQHLRLSMRQRSQRSKCGTAFAPAFAAQHLRLSICASVRSAASAAQHLRQHLQRSICGSACTPACAAQQERHSICASICANNAAQQERHSICASICSVAPVAQHLRWHLQHRQLGHRQQAALEEALHHRGVGTGKGLAHSTASICSREKKGHFLTCPLPTHIHSHSRTPTPTPTSTCTFTHIQTHTHTHTPAAAPPAAAQPDACAARLLRSDPCPAASARRPACRQGGAAGTGAGRP